MAIYEIPATNFSTLQAKIEKLNRKATRLGTQAIIFKVLDTIVRPTTNDDLSIPYDRTYKVVEVEGVAPKVDGWEFVAKVEPHEGGNIVKALPNAGDLPLSLRTTDMTCDHCGINRYRNDIFVLRKDGEYKQVGRNCLADFLGGQSPETIAKRAEIDWLLFEGIDDEKEGRDWFGPRPREHVDTVLFVSVVEALARTYGFVKRSDYAGTPTANEAWDFLTWKEKNDQLTKDGFKVEQRDVSLASTAVAWAKMQIHSNNDFLYNIARIASNETLDQRAIGYAAAIIPAFYRAQEQEEKKSTEPKHESTHLGAVGQKMTFPNLTVKKVLHFDGMYGVTHMVSMRDQLGNVIIWKTSTWQDWMEEGSVVTLKATVKEHNDYKGTKQTVITRASAL